MSKYIPVIGLEVHCELKSNSKNFSCSKNGDGEVNTNLCPLDLGYPGTLPVVNREAVRKSLMVALALNCKVPEKLCFDRKNYYYPIGTHGYVMIDTDNGPKKITIQDTHLEEDTANMDHMGNYSLIDYNRAGVPLLETVTDPCIGSADEAILYLEALRNIFLYLDVSDARADLGQIRVDVNVSLMKEGDSKLGTRTEMKGINSFKTVRECIISEIDRQTKVLESGGTIEQETRRYDEALGVSVAMREKSDSVDYRYYRESNIPEIRLRDSFIDSVRSGLPILEYERKHKYIEEYGIGKVDASTLTKDKKLSDYFEKVISYGSNPVDTSNMIVGFILGYMNKNFLSLDDIKIKEEDFASIIKMMNDGKISNKQAKDIFTKAVEENKNVMDIAKEMGSQISDKEEIRKIINEVFNENSKVIEDYKSGKNVNGFIMGLIMKRTSGKVNPGVTNIVLKEELEKL